MNYKIQIKPAGLDYQASVEDTLLSAALANDLILEHSCRKGECGLCSATLLSGSVKTAKGETVDSGEILTCCSYPQSDLTLTANCIPELAAVKCQTLPCKVAGLAFKAESILILHLRLPETSRFNYLPGQYIDLIYKGIRRSYSIANAETSASGIELHIRLLPDGVFSRLLSEECGSAQLMRLEGPKGTFFVREAANSIIFLAGGTGFAPVKAMVEALLHSQTERTIYLYWGMSKADGFYSDCPRYWAEQYSFIHYIPVVSEESADWTGRRGLVHEAVLEDFSDLEGFHVYACGSPLMINAAKETFTAKGLGAAHFYADIFVSSK
jgi:CDP-4-dehydro-6-deoxyglucose reductase